MFLFMAMPWLCFFHLLVRLWFHISWLILLWPLLKGRGLRGWSRSIRLGPHWTSCWSCDASAGRPGIEILGSSRPHRCSVLIESGKEMTLDWTWTFRVTVTCGKLDMAIGCEVCITFSLYRFETQKIFQTSGKLTWIALNFLLIIWTILSISFGVMGRVLDCSLRRFMTWVVNSLQPCSYFSTSWNWHTKKIDINYVFAVLQLVPLSDQDTYPPISFPNLGIWNSSVCPYLLVDCSDLSELVFVVCVFDGGSVVAKGRRGRGTTLVRACKSKRVDVISDQHKNCKLISRKLINIHGKTQNR